MTISTNFPHRPIFPIIFTILLFCLSSINSAFAESVLHRGNGAEPETLDMHQSTGIPEANILRDLFEGLITEAADGSLIAGAAESWTQSADGLTWVFKLRKNGKWSDGKQVTADDFVSAYQRALNPKTASEYAFILWPLKNAKAISKGENTDLSQLGVKALDNLSLELTLENPTPYLTGLLSHPMSYPIPRHVPYRNTPKNGREPEI